MFLSAFDGEAGNNVWIITPIPDIHENKSHSTENILRFPKSLRPLSYSTEYMLHDNHYAVVQSTGS